MGFKTIAGHIFLFGEIVVIEMITNIYVIGRHYVIFIQLTWLIIKRK